MVFLASLVFVISMTMLGSNAELRAVVQVFRHGERTPTTFYPNYARADKSYWGGLDVGQLTNEGKRQHYALGHFTRRRYSTFLPTKYNRSVVYVETTDVDRTHMSAQSNLYGLFPAKTGDQQWHKNTDWQPIPIHPAKETIFYGTSLCNKYSVLQTEAVNDELSEEIDKKYESVYKHISYYSGSNITSYAQIHSVFDTMKIETDVGYSIAEWGKSIYPEPLTTIAGHFFELFSRTTQMKRFFLGAFLDHVVKYFENMAKDPNYSKKYLIYSGHDSNIASLLNSFGAFDPPYPPQFASTIYLELHVENWKNIIKVFSKDGNNIKQISVNGCPLDCPLEQFREVLSELIADEATLKKECDEIAGSTSAPMKFQSSVSTMKKFTVEEITELFKPFAT